MLKKSFDAWPWLQTPARKWSCMCVFVRSVIQQKRISAHCAAGIVLGSGDTKTSHTQTYLQGGDSLLGELDMQKERTLYCDEQ